MAEYIIDNVASPINWQESDAVQRTLQNAKNLLMCRMGEVPFDRLRGFNPDFYNRPITEINEDIISELDEVMMWEPDVEVADAYCRLLDDGSLYIQVTIDVTIGEADEE